MPSLTASPTPKITLYTGQSPNGIKISIALAFLDIPYAVRKLDFSNQEQKSAWFTEINPNGRIPAITDTLADGEEVHVWESGAILQYLVEKYDGKERRISYAPGTSEWVQMTSWLHFQMSGVGPMQGQANHFRRYSQDKIPYGIDRYTTETKRLYTVMDKHLAKAKSSYFVGEKCTIADISLWGWVSLSKWCDVELQDYPALKAWEERMFKLEAVEKGRHVPDPHHRELLQSKEETEAFEKKAKAFVQQAYKDDVFKSKEMAEEKAAS